MVSSSQVNSYEHAGSDDEEMFMMESPCIKEIIDLAGVRRNKLRRNERAKKEVNKMKKAIMTKATTTPLVRYENDL